MRKHSANTDLRRVERRLHRVSADRRGDEQQRFAERLRAGWEYVERQLTLDADTSQLRRVRIIRTRANRGRDLKHNVDGEGGALWPSTSQLFVKH
jgi:hypothetical protein